MQKKTIIIATTILIMLILVLIGLVIIFSNKDNTQMNLSRYIDKTWIATNGDTRLELKLEKDGKKNVKYHLSYFTKKSAAATEELWGEWIYGSKIEFLDNENPESACNYELKDIKYEEDRIEMITKVISIHNPNSYYDGNIILNGFYSFRDSEVLKKEQEEKEEKENELKKQQEEEERMKQVNNTQANNAVQK